MALLTDCQSINMPSLVALAFDLSKTQARRLIEQGAIRLDGERCIHLTYARKDVDGRILSKGKREFRRVRLT